MTWREWALLASTALSMGTLFVSAINAWGSKNIQLAIALLRGEVIERVAKCEGQLEGLRSAVAAATAAGTKK